MAKKKFTIDENEVIDNVQEPEPVAEEVAPEKKSNVHPNSLANLHPRTPGRTPKKYMQLDIKGFEEYLNLISKHHGVTRTRYIQNLIRKDMEENQDLYQALKTVRDLSN